jgi:hypothetical protein
MSRGMGIWQRAIREAIDRTDKLVPLGGKSRAEQASLLRAAKSLEKTGQCVLVRLWNEDHTIVRPYVGRPDLTFDGKPAQEVSVATVPCGTRATLTGSIRQLAAELGVSKSTIDRDLRKIEGRPAAGAPLQKIRRLLPKLTLDELREVQRWLDKHMGQCEGDEIGPDV